MILTKKQIEQRVSSENNIINKIESGREQSSRIEHSIEIRDGINHVGRPGSKNLSDEEKVIIGSAAHLLGNEVAAQLMGVSEVTARHLRSGQTTLSEGAGTQRAGVNLNLKTKIQDRLNDTKLTIQERAAEKLLGAMGLLDEDRLEKCTAKDLAQISNQMSQVVRNMNSSNSQDQGGDSGKSKVKIIINRPKDAREDSFDVIEIGA